MAETFTGFIECRPAFIPRKYRKKIIHQEDDHSEVKKVKSKMQEEIGKRTTAAQTSLLACLLNPFSKDEKFCHGFA